MEESNKKIRLSKVAKEFNVGTNTIIDFLGKKGVKVDTNPNTILTPEAYDIIVKEYQQEKHVKEESKKAGQLLAKPETVIAEKPEKPDVDEEDESDDEMRYRIKNIHPAYSLKSDYEAKDKIIETKVEVVKVAPEKIIEPQKQTEEQKDENITATQVETAENIEKKDTSENEPRIKVIGKMNLDDLQTKKSSKKVKSKEEVVETEIKQEEDIIAEAVKGKSKSKKNTSEEDNTIEEKFGEITLDTKASEIVIVTNAPEEQIPEVKIPQEEVVDENFIKTEVQKLEGPKILGKMNIPEPKESPKKQLIASSSDAKGFDKKKKRKRIKKELKLADPTAPKTEEKTEAQPEKERFKFKKHVPGNTKKTEVSGDEIEKQIKETLARLSSGGGKSKASKYRKEKRQLIQQQFKEEQIKLEEDKKILKVTEFVTANELASLMSVSVNDVISTCMALGLFVSINQRLDAETIAIVADEFGYKVEFIDAETEEVVEEELDDPKDLVGRHPIVTVMGHVDHGKTSLLDYIRNANVIAGEAGGITQHIGAYEVTLEKDKRITFLDTPGHEAFTAMRARGAKVTDVAIIVIAADDNVMPQTIEAINHAQAARVPLIFAINKIDKAGANPEKIKEELSKMNILVEDWGGKYQSQEISAKKGVNVETLLEKVLLESEMLELKANPSRLSLGTVLESSLEKGRGYVAKILVQNGTLHIGDMVLAGSYFGRVKAMYNERNLPVKEAGPSTPVLMLGLNGAPQAGDTFKCMTDEREVRTLATRRQQIVREQGIRTQKHITLDEIGRRIAIGNFKELNIIVKGDFDGSVEALSDSLMKLSTPEVQVNVIHKSVGPIIESDVLLASASNAIIIGFQVRPALGAKKLAEQEQIEIKHYSIIYTAINEIKSAIEGMLSPEIEEKILCNLEVREVFNITKVGTIAGCIVLDGKIQRSTKIRVIRNGIVVFTGVLGSLKRFKDEVKEAVVGQDCGLNIERFNDVKVADIIEGYEEIEIKRKLS
jgi:translation initiation factor IF-2